MKFFTKLILISLSILLFTACSNETEKIARLQFPPL